MTARLHNNKVKLDKGSKMASAIVVNSESDVELIAA